MKRFAGHASGIASAPIEQCFDRLADLTSYPHWYPEGVRSAEVVSDGAGGEPVRVRAALTLSRGPLHFDHDVPLQVSLERPTRVVFERVADGSHDREQLRVSWRLQPVGEARTELTVEMTANLALPAFVPGLGRIADDVARGFLDAAVRAAGG